MLDGQFPPSSNRGGNPPTTNVIVDWVSVSFPRSACGTSTGEFLKEVRRLFDGTVTQFRERNGLHGYAFSCVSDVGGVIVAWGGNNDTVFLQIPGDACGRVECFASLRDFIEQRCGHITRVDLAFDDFGGARGIDFAVDLYRAGAFAGARGGARSGCTATSCSQAGNWLEPDGKGRTLYVGKLRNGKMLCVYEKGRQLGDATSPWVRWEVRLADRDRAIPLQCLTSPAEFARGAYPALEFIDGPSCRISTRRHAERISVAKLTHHARESYGPLLDVLRRSGASASECIERIRRDGVPARLSAPTEAQLADRVDRLVAECLHEEADAMIDAWMHTTEVAGGRVGRVADEPPHAEPWSSEPGEEIRAACAESTPTHRHSEGKSWS
jgi:phage replication initiation protein